MQSFPKRYTAEEILVWLNTNINNHDAIKAFLKDCRDRHLGDRFVGSDHLYDIIVAAILFDNINLLDKHKLIDARDVLEIVTGVIGKQKKETLVSFNNHPVIIDPGQILTIINVALQLINFLIKYLQNSSLCKKKSNFHIINEALMKLDGKNPIFNLGGIKLTYGNLDNVNLSNVNLTKAQIKVTSMKNANFDYSVLRDAFFDGTDLTGATFLQSDLSWCLFINTTMKQIKLSPLTLQEFCKTQLPLPDNFTVPGSNDIKTILNDIHEDLKSEKNLEPNSKQRFNRKVNRHFYHQLVSENIERITQKMEKPEVIHDTCIDLLNHHFFKGHRSSKWASGTNNALVSIHNLFSAHRSDVPYVCAGNEKPLKRSLKEAESKIGKHEPGKATDPTIPKPTLQR